MADVREEVGQAVAPDVRLEYRRAIEALRAGVPNGDAVRVLGSDQPSIEEKFRQRLQDVPDDLAKDAPTAGLLIAGDFGTGKSHLLEYLRHVALGEGFVCSKIVLSKETPLYDLAKLYRAAIESATVPGKKGAALPEIAAGLDFANPAYAEFFRWANRQDVGLNAQLSATLFLFERVKDQEVRDRLLSFWAGDPLRVADLRGWLQAHGEPGRYKREPGATKDLPLHRFRFVARLIAAAGYAGWVLLVDEVELIGRYSLRQRGASYAELARLAGKVKEDGIPGLFATFAITTDFTEAVLEQRNDLTVIPERYRARGTPADTQLAQRAERGMRTLSRETVRLTAPSKPAIDRTRQQVHAIHAQAYDWQPPPLGSYERLTTTSMRQYVRRWINEWDLQRLYPGYAVDTIVGELTMDYSEDLDLEAPGEEEGEAPV